VADGRIRRANRWFSGLGIVQQAIIWLFIMLFVFFTFLLVNVAFIKLVRSVDQSSAPSGTGAVPEGTGSDIELRISDARWEGGRPVVEGTWRGEVSSVHCDLLEGGPEGGVTDWWDRRKSRTRMDPTKRSFTQEFRKAKGRKIEDPIDSGASYGVACRALFSNGGQAGDEALVEGTPPR